MNETRSPVNDNDPGSPGLVGLRWEPHDERPDLGLLSGRSLTFSHISFTAVLIDDVERQAGFYDSRIIGFDAKHVDEPDRTFSFRSNDQTESEWQKWDENDLMFYEVLGVLSRVYDHVEDTYGRDKQAVVRKNLEVRTLEAAAERIEAIEEDQDQEQSPERDDGIEMD